jgi:small subunit ribosomal protein S18
MAKEFKEKKVYTKRNHEEEDYMNDDMDEGKGRGRKFSGGKNKKSCRFMSGEEDTANITYKNPKFLSTFMTEHGKIVSRRITGNCAMVQRKLALEIKRARNLALLGFVSVGPNSN